MAQRLVRVFYLIFGGVLLLLLCACVLGWQYNSLLTVLAAAGLGAAILFGFRRLSPIVEKMPRPVFNGLFWGLAAIYLVLLHAVGFQLTEVLTSDLGVVYDSLKEFLAYGHPYQNNDYYIICNNNLGLALVLAAFYRLVGLFGIAPDDAGIAAGISLNCFAIFATVVLLCLAVRLLTGRQSAQLLALVCGMLFVPFYLWVPYFYSDTLCMPWLMAAVLVMLGYARRPHWGWAVLAGAVSFVGFAIKGSLAVLPVAAALTFLLACKNPSFKQRMLAAVLVLAVFFGLWGGYRAFQRGYLDWSNEETVAFPTTLWLCYGSHGDGNYNQADADLCQSLPDLTTRKQVMGEELLRNYTDRSLRETMQFELKKAVLTWGDGEYGAAEYLASPAKGSVLQMFTLAGQPFTMPLIYYCQAVQYLLLFFCGAGCLFAAKQPDGAFFCRMSLFGVMLFLSFWETKARYALHFAPVLLLCAALAVDALAAQKNKADTK